MRLGLSKHVAVCMYRMRQETLSLWLGPGPSPSPRRPPCGVGWEPAVRALPSSDSHSIPHTYAFNTTPEGYISRITRVKI